MPDKKVLVIGGTGAMGVYLVPELLSMGYEVDVVSLDNRISDNPRLKYIVMDCASDSVMEAYLKQNHYDGIVDFMIYNTLRFRSRCPIMLENTDHYIYLSTYRIYAGDCPISETSGRLLDVSTDSELLASDDYCMHKARGEDLLESTGKKNWTVIRPAITYSQRRFQLVTLEAQVHLPRAAAGKTVVLPEEALDREATMSWGGDVGRMIARLLFNPLAYGERFSVCTAEHHTWREIAGYYEELIGLKYVTTDNETYARICGGEDFFRQAYWQLVYDRLFDRVMDNSKILRVTGMKQSELMPLKDGLRMELSHLPKDFVWPDTPINDRMDAWLESRK